MKTQMERGIFISWPCSLTFSYSIVHYIMSVNEETKSANFEDRSIISSLLWRMLCLRFIGPTSYVLAT